MSTTYPISSGFKRKYKSSYVVYNTYTGYCSELFKFVSSQTRCHVQNGRNCRFNTSHLTIE